MVDDSGRPASGPHPRRRPSGTLAYAVARPRRCHVSGARPALPGHPGSSRPAQTRSPRHPERRTQLQPQLARILESLLAIAGIIANPWSVRDATWGFSTVARQRAVDDDPSCATPSPRPVRRWSQGSRRGRVARVGVDPHPSPADGLGPGVLPSPSPRRSRCSCSTRRTRARSPVSCGGWPATWRRRRRRGCGGRGPARRRTRRARRRGPSSTTTTPRWFTCSPTSSAICAHRRMASAGVTSPARRRSTSAGRGRAEEPADDPERGRLRGTALPGAAYDPLHARRGRRRLL